MRAESLTTYELMKNEIEQYLEVKVTKLQGAAPMDVDALSKGRGKGKGIKEKAKVRSQKRLGPRFLSREVATTVENRGTSARTVGGRMIPARRLNPSRKQSPNLRRKRVRAKEKGSTA